MTRALPSPIIQSRRRRCAGCACEVDFSSPCARCPRGHWRPVFCDAPLPPSAGPGTELKRLLSRLGIQAAGNCQCNARAAEMDRRGPDWCEQNIEEVVAWLGEEAGARRLPFVAPAARFLIRRAIAQARRNAQPAQGR